MIDDTSTSLLSSPEEQRLLARYHAAAHRYTDAVTELCTLRATLSRADYQQLLQIVEDSRQECRQVRTALGYTPSLGSW